MSTTVHTKSGDVFESHCDLIDVTSMRRPDPTWVFVDALGHEHRWYVERDGQTHVAMPTYDPQRTYKTPTLIYVKDGESCYEDGEPYEYGHLECASCGEHVQPRHTADTQRQYIPGLRYYTINGEPVSPEEFKRRLIEAGLSQ